MSATIQKHNRSLEPILRDFVTESLINELGFIDGEINMMAFYIFNQLLYGELFANFTFVKRTVNYCNLYIFKDVWKTDYSTMNDYRNQLRRIVARIQNRNRATRSRLR